MSEAGDPPPEVPRSSKVLKFELEHTEQLFAKENEKIGPASPLFDSVLDSRTRTVRRYRLETGPREQYLVLRIASRIGKGTRRPQKRSLGFSFLYATSPQMFFSFSFFNSRLLFAFTFLTHSLIHSFSLSLSISCSRFVSHLRFHEKTKQFIR